MSLKAGSQPGGQRPRGSEKIRSRIAVTSAIGVFIDAAWPRPETNPDWGPLPAIEWFVGGVIVVWAIAMVVMRRQRGRSAPAVDPLQTPG